MNEPIPKTFMIKYDIYKDKNTRSLNKDLFSKKLGQLMNFDTSGYKQRKPSLNIAKFNNNKNNSIVKNRTNLMLTSEREEELPNFISKLKNPFYPETVKIRANENHKQIGKNQSLINTYNINIKYNKKQIKEILSLKEKNSFRPQNNSNIISDNIFNLNFSKDREKRTSMKELETFNSRKIIKAFWSMNIKKKLKKKEYSKDLLGTGFRRKINQKIQIEMKRNLNDSKESINTSIPPIDIKDNNNIFNENIIKEDKKQEDKNQGEKNQNENNNNINKEEQKEKEKDNNKKIEGDNNKKDKDNDKNGKIDLKEKNIEEENNKKKENCNNNNKDDKIKNNNEKKDKEKKDINKPDKEKENEKKKNESKEKEFKDSIIFLTHFYEDFIELANNYDSNEKYNELINKFNKTYFFLFDLKAFPKTQMNIQFLNSFKYISILIICLIFVTKDDALYKQSTSVIKELLKKFVFLCLNSINYKLFETEKIKNFMNNKKYQLNQPQNMTLNDIINIIINELFNEKKNDYKKLRKCIRQLINNINNDTPETILNIVNNSILYCHNCKYYIDENVDICEIKNKKKKGNNKENIKNENNDKKKEEEKSLNNNIHASAPYIKKKSEKKYCLVLDLDETLIHNLNLPFGSYFFVRPGLFDFLEKLHDIFEIIVFTASKKNYAYSIINKIDYKNYISNILHKKYITYDDGIAVKKLDLMGRDLNKLIFVDNLETCAKYNKKNLYCISSWYNNIYDNELHKLQEKLISIANSGKYNDDITKGLLEK